MKEQAIFAILIIILYVIILFRKKIKYWFQGWRAIKNPPKWVWKAYWRWDKKLATHPYNMRKHFVGKVFVYRVQHGMGAQGEAPILGWWKKKK